MEKGGYSDLFLLDIWFKNFGRDSSASESKTFKLFCSSQDDRRKQIPLWFACKMRKQEKIPISV